ncbi:MAG: SLC13 family permease [Bacteroidetes bacterium]|nr:SLC13 family permease [Bacteroidota bacterium]
MTLEMGIVLGLIMLAIALFATERVGVDLTAVIIMAALLATGILSPAEGLSGFSNPATVTVAAMFVISAALRATGAVNGIALFSTRIFRKSYWTGLILTMLLIGVASAFINNTPVVAVFIPVLLGVSRDTGISSSRLLMPISFASMFGGLITLVGTSTNILVSSIAVDHGMPPFGMFEFSALGVCFLVVGMLYMILAGVHWIPKRTVEKNLTKQYDMADYLTDVVLHPVADSVGKKIAESRLVKDLDVDVLEVIREGSRIHTNLGEVVLQAGDILRLRVDVRQIQELKNTVGCSLKDDRALEDEDFDADELALMEVIIAPNSTLVGTSLRNSGFRNTFRATTLAIRHRGELLHEGFRDTRLRAGDAILIEVARPEIDRIISDPRFVVASEVELPHKRTERLVPALLITGAVIAAATFELLPIVTAAVLGAILLVATRCLTLEEVYHAVEWKVVFLLGGIISLGVAMEKTGLAEVISTGMIDIVGEYGPLVLLGALYLLTTLLTGIMSNNATAILIAPIAISAAEALGISARPLLVAVTFAASASFMTPVGYQTNTMIYGVGQYRFSDFLKVGTPLTLLFWILGILLIPIFFPF